MRSELVWEKLTALFRDVLENEEIVLRPETTAADLEEWDSLTNVQLLVAMEQAFEGVRFGVGEIANLKNVGELVNVIERRARG